VNGIALGSYHSLVLVGHPDGSPSHRTTVLSCGDGRHGQLGLPQAWLTGGQSPLFVPVPAIQHIHIVALYAGGRSSAAVSHTGELYVWGHK
jgi:alpha-tubulin suppressor-like RCC1 family protein